jgi:hypothetical protein
MHLSHAEVDFRDFLQSLFAVTCHSSWLAMQAMLPMLALSLYFTDGENNNNDNGGDGSDGDDDVGRIVEALILLVVGRYSVQVSRIKPCRQAIEWSHGDVENIFQICSNAKSYRIGKRLPYANEQLRVCHLLSNCYTRRNYHGTNSKIQN